MNATQPKLTLAQAYQVLASLAAHPSVKLNLEEHNMVHAALLAIKPELTNAPELATV